MYCIAGNLTEEEKVAACYKHDLVDYDEYYVNLAEGPDIYPMILELDLTLPFDIKCLFDIKNLAPRSHPLGCDLKYE